MNNNIKELQLEINYHVHAIHELGEVIKQLDYMIMTDNHPHITTDELTEQMLSVADNYKEVVNKTRILLEAYFAEETKAGLPADFLFRRLYQKVKNAY